MNLKQSQELNRWLIQFRTDNAGLLEAAEGIVIVFSRVKPASWPLLHAARAGMDRIRTLCGIDISGEWDADGDCTACNVECKRCLAILIADAERPSTSSQSLAISGTTNERRIRWITQN